MIIVLAAVAVWTTSYIGAIALFNLKRWRASDGLLTWLSRCLLTCCEAAYGESIYPRSIYNVHLHCGHDASLVSHETPTIGDLVWCPAHNGRFGPSILTAIAEVNPEMDDRPKIFAELD